MISNMLNDAEITAVNFQEKVEDIERMVRHSPDYRLWVANVYDSFSNQIISPDMLDVTIDEKTNIKTECHHAVLNLYTIVSIVGTDMLLNLKQGEHLYLYDIEKAVMMVHLNDEICCAVISKTFHDAIHAGKRALDKSTPGLHLGNVANFIKKYRTYITDDEVKAYKELGANIEIKEE